MNKKTICNSCGKEIIIRNRIAQEDYLYIKKEWGYFSEKDGVIHEFNLCEKCYDNIVKTFQKPVQTIDVNELM